MAKEKTITMNRALNNMTRLLLKLHLGADYVSLSKDYSFKLMDILKEWYKENDEYFIEKHLSYDTFVSIFSYASDVYYMYKSNGAEGFDKNFGVLREGLINSLKDKENPIEIFLAVNRICSSFDKRASDENKLLYGNDVNLFTNIAFILTLSAISGIYKFKNNRILKFEEVDDSVIIKYSKEALLTKEELSVLGASSKVIPPGDKFAPIVEKVMLNIDTAYQNLMESSINPEFRSKEFEVIKFKDSMLVNTPFTRDGNPIIDESELLKIPKDRKYLTPRGGVRFEFLDKSLNIDYIDMVEDDKYFLFNVFFINNGNITASDKGTIIEEELLSKSGVTLEGKIKVRKDKIRIPFAIPKNKFKDGYTIHDIVSGKQTVGANIVSATAESYSVTYMLLSCIYVALYNPHGYSNIFNIYNITKNKQGGYTRENSFRIAHLRKLPEGYKASPEAKAEAKKAGFDNVPEGYTFVSEHNSNKEDKTKRKVIKI